MPSASDELRKQMTERFGSINDDGPMHYLQEAGYVLNRDWTWKPKDGVTCLRDMTRDEFDCLLFLIHEWDFAGLEGAANA